MTRHPDARFNYGEIPPHMAEALISYITTGRLPGGFLCAVIDGDLNRACDCADAENLWLLPIYSAWLFNVAPAGAHGSLGRRIDWMDSGGLCRRDGAETAERWAARARESFKREPVA